MTEDEEEEMADNSMDTNNTSSGPSTIPPQSSPNTTEQITYNVTTSNRFSPLPVPIPEPTTLRIPSPPKTPNPPAFHVFEPVSTFKPLLQGNRRFVTQNLRNCTKIVPSSVEDHKWLYSHLKSKNIAFHTHPTETTNTKRFVLHDLNSHPLEDIYEDLQKYGLLPTLIAAIPVKYPRFADQATYVVHYDKSSNITLDIIKQVKYICNTVARWTHFTTNGDGVSVCSRCSTLGHTGAFCNRPPKCKVCSKITLQMTATTLWQNVQKTRRRSIRPT